MITFSPFGFHGRLGNQLWQLASTAGIASKAGQNFVLPNWVYKKYFSVPEKHFRDPPYSPDDHPIEAHNTRYVEHMHPSARPYMQDYRLWSHMSNTIKQWLQPSELAEEHIAWINQFPKPILSLHVRRGDNANEGDWKAAYHPLRPMSYYREALSMMEGKYKTLVIFSDDPQWCRENFSNLNAEFYEGVSRPKEHEPDFTTAPVLDWIDLQMMSKCDYHILSNSTYSWWGAFLSNDKNPIYPWPFFGPALQYIDATLLFPNHWTRLPHGEA